MTAQALAHKPDLLDIEDFELFLYSRPDGEKWELWDGHARMMSPPDLQHQTIARNLITLLVPALRRARPELRVLQEAGVQIGPLERTLLVPDVMVFPRPPHRRRYALDLVLAIEIESPTNRKGEIPGKFRRYQALPSALWCVHFDNRLVKAEVLAKSDDGQWMGTWLEGADARLVLPALGFDHSLAEIYEDTPALDRRS